MSPIWIILGCLSVGVNVVLAIVALTQCDDVERANRIRDKARREADKARKDAALARSELADAHAGRVFYKELIHKIHHLINGDDP
jgi:hypothetical protein